MSSPFQKQFSKKTPFLQRIQSESASEIRTSDVGDVNLLPEFITKNNVDYTLGDKSGSTPNTYIEKRIIDETTGQSTMKPLSDEEKLRMLTIRGLNEDNSIVPYQDSHGVLGFQGRETSSSPVKPRTVIVDQPTTMNGMPNPDRTWGDYSPYPEDYQITEEEYRTNRWNTNRSELQDFQAKGLKPRKTYDSREKQMPALRETDSTNTMNQRGFNANKRIALGNNMDYFRNPNQ